LLSQAVVAAEGYQAVVAAQVVTALLRELQAAVVQPKVF
jgi:hypothetical protein